jgi:hypothetical protein
MGCLEVGIGRILGSDFLGNELTHVILDGMNDRTALV